MNDESLAYFITWTVYGTRLQGDPRGWRKRRKGIQPPQPPLAQWRHERLKHSILLLDDTQQAVVAKEIQKHCDHRGWRAWKINARTNHVHIVVTATGYAGDTVRDQCKANATRGLRQQWRVFIDRPVWTVLGDWECINTEDDLLAVVEYAGDAQDRMEYKE